MDTLAKPLGRQAGEENEEEAEKESTSDPGLPEASDLPGDRDSDSLSGSVRDGGNEDGGIGYVHRPADRETEEQAMTGTGYSNVVPFPPNRYTASAPRNEIAEPEPEIAEPSGNFAQLNAEPEQIAEPVKAENEKVRPIGAKNAESEPSEIAEPAEMAEIGTTELAEPEAIPVEIAEPTPLEIAEPGPEGTLIAEPKASEIAEPKESPANVRTLEAETSEPEEDEDVEISTPGFKDEKSRLWNLTTYKDRHGKLRAKHVLRFVTHPPKRDAGVITADIAAQLEQRKGRGRWKASRDEAAGQLKVSAQSIADAYWRTRGVRKHKSQDV